MKGHSSLAQVGGFHALWFMLQELFSRREQPPIMSHLYLHKYLFFWKAREGALVLPEHCSEELWLRARVF